MIIKTLILKGIILEHSFLSRWLILEKQNTASNALFTTVLLTSTVGICFISKGVMLMI